MVHCVVVFTLCTVFCAVKYAVRAMQYLVYSVRTRNEILTLVFK